MTKEIDPEDRLVWWDNKRIPLLLRVVLLPLDWVLSAVLFEGRKRRRWGDRP